MTLGFKCWCYFFKSVYPASPTLCYVEFDVDEKLISLYESKDFGPYGENGKMPVCFIGTNHTTGGSSGSAVIDAYGNLIGLNFDRAWEGTMSDIYFDPDIYASTCWILTQACRNPALFTN